MIYSMTIIVAAVAIIIVAIAVVAIYYLHYYRVINKRLKEQPENGKRMLSPKTVGIFTVIAALLLFSISVLVVRINQSDAARIDEKYMTAQFDYDLFTPQEMQHGFLENYSINDNAGYEKHEEILGEIKFTYFVSNSAYNVFHPAFIIFAEYIGPEDIVTLGFQGDFLTNERVPVVGKGGSGTDAQEYICILGNTSIDCVFQLSLFYYDADGDMAVNNELDTAGTDATGNNADYTAAAATITIDISRASTESK